jgi:hypothetical protein
MSNVFVPAIILGILALILYKLKDSIIIFIEKIIGRFVILPKGLSGKIFPAFIRVVRLNWYTFLMMFLLWLLLFKIELGKDIINAYLSKLILLNADSFWEKTGSMFALFFCTFIMSLSVWILPFYMYSEERKRRIESDVEKFYLGTKILALVAMLPFLIIVNAFIVYPISADNRILYAIIINILSFILFLFFAHKFNQNPGWLSFGWMNYSPLAKLKNPYLKIVFQILIYVMLLTILFSFLFIFFGSNYNLWSYGFAVFMFISSVIVFRLLLYSNQDGEDSATLISQHVAQMLGEENKGFSKHLYLFLILSLTSLVVYYYLVPSLEPTNSIYILLIVFSFFIIYLDYWRNKYSNSRSFSRVLALLATLFFLVVSFIPFNNQFRVLFVASGNVITPKLTLESAIEKRYRAVLEKGDSTVYIVSGMGGGSRAGYITLETLRKLDSISPGLSSKTICFSTVSGSSVGVYSYLKARQERIPQASNFSELIYQRNYNSSGVFGLLIGDAIETTFSWIATSIRSFITNSHPSNNFHDRNYRLRQEYDYALHEALSQGDRPLGYAARTFYSLRSDFKQFVPDTFQQYFSNHLDSTPIHLVNTFEVNSGRRAVISPFPLRDTNFFPNAMLPLQDRRFDSNWLRKDILYREAVNLSELFPFISAASSLGQQYDAQFVDGGYFENYGLATVMDVIYYLKDSLHVPVSRIKVILVKNSLQEPEKPKLQFQYLAPLTGAMNSPFTGHANHILLDIKRIIPRENLCELRFDAEKKRVPLSRSLNASHIDSMKSFIDSLKFNVNLLQFVK